MFILYLQSILKCLHVCYLDIHMPDISLAKNNKEFSDLTAIQAIIVLYLTLFATLPYCNIKIFL